MYLYFPILSMHYDMSFKLQDELSSVAKQMAVEAQQNNIAQELLADMPNQAELAGDPNAIKEPSESILCM